MGLRTMSFVYLEILELNIDAWWIIEGLDLALRFYGLGFTGLDLQFVTSLDLICFG